MVVNKQTATKPTRGPSSAMPDKTPPDEFVSKQLFISSALSMSWQMAIAVLVPMVGGYYLDQHLHTTPWLTLAGFLIAIILVVLIVRKTIKELPDYTRGKVKK
jgi:F0F1-type ATP synthase assembly protein I